MPRRNIRGRYRNPTEEERHAIIDAHLAGEDYREGAAACEIASEAGHRMVHHCALYLRTNEVAPGPQGGRTSSKLDDESRESPRDAVEGQPIAHSQASGWVAARNLTRQASRINDNRVTSTSQRVHHCEESDSSACRAQLGPCQGCPSRLRLLDDDDWTRASPHL